VTDIEIDGRTYKLALGPAILRKLAGRAKVLLPISVQRSIHEYKKEHSIDDDEQDLELVTKFMTDQQVEDLNVAADMYEVNTLTIALRAIDGNRMTTNEIDSFLEEEAMPIETFKELISTINDAVLAFQEAAEISGESKTSSPVQTVVESPLV